MSLVGMIKEDLVAERIAIDSYRDIIQYLGTQDSNYQTHAGIDPSR